MQSQSIISNQEIEWICSPLYGRGLTPRSTGPATAGGVRLARSGFATVARQPYAARLRGPVTSNVRQHNPNSCHCNTFKSSLCSQQSPLCYSSPLHTLKPCPIRQTLYLGKRQSGRVVLRGLGRPPDQGYIRTSNDWLTGDAYPRRMRPKCPMARASWRRLAPLTYLAPRRSR
jgi:hypothetical protein